MPSIYQQLKTCITESKNVKKRIFRSFLPKKYFLVFEKMSHYFKIIVKTPSGVNKHNIGYQKVQEILLVQVT